MGQHFVPQWYLEQFSSRRGWIWLHDKEKGAITEVPIAKAAQSSGFYDPGIEIALDREIESPANNVMRKVLDRQSISAAERWALAQYVAIMLTRTKKYRDQVMESYPRELARFIVDTKCEVIETGLGSNGVPALTLSLLDFLDAWAIRHAEKPPDNLAEWINTPHATPGMVIAIYAMQWRVLVAGDGERFVATDHPAFFFTSWGLGTQQSELCFPLSSTHALHGSFQRAEAPLVYLPARKGGVKEVNRRLASDAGRMAFSCRRETWILPVMRKPGHYLSAIRWSDPPKWVEPPPQPEYPG